MDRLGDHDGKSTSASAVDKDHYPEAGKDSVSLPTAAQIAERAHKMWVEQGRPSNSAERNWLEAERELISALKSRSLLEKVQERAGSVQR